MQAIQRRPLPLIVGKIAPDSTAIPGLAMSDSFPAPRAAFVADSDTDAQQALRALGARAHQLRAATRAADHYNAQDSSDDRNTGSWLMSCALGLSLDLANDIDSVARSLKDRPIDTVTLHRVSGLRVRAHQLHAAAKAADHFLDQDSHEDRDTGSWLIATASGLAQKLAAEIDDGVNVTRRPSREKPAVEAHDPGFARRVKDATAAARDVA